MKKKLKVFIKNYFINYKYLSIFIALFIILLITRFYGLETKSGFGFDQVDNAWAAKNIIVDSKLPLVGMQAKGNTGFYIGPYYYYLVVPFYLLSRLDPVASGFIAGVTAIFAFLVTYFVTRSIFNEKVAIFTLFITTFSPYILDLDRVQWPVNFIVPLSFLILFSLYQIFKNKPKYFLLLAVSFGFSLHIHFTSIFYGLLILICLPFIPRNKESLKYIVYSILIFLFFLFPILLNYFQTNSGVKATSYLGSSFHGFHLRRLIQIIGDGFIEFNALLRINNSLFISIPSFILFLFLLWRNKKIDKNKSLVGLLVLWVLVPWIAFSTYSGELSNYYFGITRPVAIITFAYLLYRIFQLKKYYLKFMVYPILLIYMLVGFSYFIQLRMNGLAFQKEAVLSKISQGQRVEFVQGDPQSYIYYYYTQIKKKK